MSDHSAMQPYRIVIADDHSLIRQGIKSIIRTDPSLQIIGEAARLIPEDVRRLAPDVPWSKMIGMRHILVHDYFRIDTEIVWQVVANELPRLKSSLQVIEKKIDVKS